METGFLTSIEVHSISQLSLAACGLGGSSSFAVALALALLRLRAVEGKPIRYDSYNAGGAKALAEYVEMVLLNKHIGGQDHAIANAGGIWRFSYQKGYATSGHALGFLAFATLRDRMVLVPCASRAHDASEILKRQFKDLRIAEKMVSLVTPCAEALNRGEIGLVIEFLNQTWDLKAQLDGVPCASADAIVRLVRERGGGAKLCGAGGGGCVLCLMRNTEDVSKLTKEFEGAIAINPSFRGLEQVV
jgi:galactokinase/mevalonate kinase-like predicted kinase